MIGLSEESNRRKHNKRFDYNGERHHSWKGGIRRRKNGGYIEVYRPEHIFAHKRTKIVKQHRLLYEEYYNCCLLPWTDIHHLNGIKTDNRKENLIAVLHGQHSRITNKGRKHSEELRLKNSLARKGRIFVDMSNRYCSICGCDSSGTCINKRNGRPLWRRLDNGVMCNTCYCRYFRKR